MPLEQMTQARALDDLPRRLVGMVAAVTGASSGLGRAIALRLAAEGASVICGDIQREPRPDGPDGEIPTVTAIAAAGGQAEFAEWNVTDVGQTEQALDAAVDRFGRIDIIVANAAVGLGGGRLTQEPQEAWQGHLDVNVTGTWNTVRLGLKRLITQNQGGRIVTMSSIAGLIGIPGVPSGYAVSRCAAIQLARQAAVDGAPFGITANAVCPGYVRTAFTREVWNEPAELEKIEKLHPLGRIGEPSDVAAAVAFLGSPDASWITGIALPVDGGLTCV